MSQGVWRRFAWSVAALLLCVLNARCAEQHSSDLGDEDAARKKIPANVLRDLERGLTTDVVIALAEPEATSDAQLQKAADVRISSKTVRRKAMAGIKTALAQGLESARDLDVIVAIGTMRCWTTVAGTAS